MPLSEQIQAASPARPKLDRPCTAEDRETPHRTPQSFLLPWAGLLVSSFPELGGASVDTVGDSSFTLSRRVFLRAAGETFSWSAMDCSSL